MVDFTLPGATTLAQVPARRFTALPSMPVGTLLDIYQETADEIRLVPKSDFFKASVKNGFDQVSGALEKMGVDAVLEIQRRTRPPAYADAGMYAIGTRRRYMGVE